MIDNAASSAACSRCDQPQCRGCHIGGPDHPWMQSSAACSDPDSSPVIAAPAWARWSIRKMPTTGNVWRIDHDCGYYALVDLGANNHAIDEAEHDHERRCR